MEIGNKTFLLDLKVDKEVRNFLIDSLMTVLGNNML